MNGQIDVPVSREIAGAPSTANVRLMRDRYLSEPLYVDVEYIRHYTDAHRRTDGMNAFERRAECHAWALEHLTPSIRDGEPFAGGKTRYVRGAIPYCNYACGYVLRELRHEEQEAQDSVTDLGTGGGIGAGREISGKGGYSFFGGKFLLSHEDRETLKSCAEYFRGKCMQDVGDALWKSVYPQASYIENGWKAVLYTAPHDPAPEGRFVLDFETALAEGLNGVIARARAKIAEASVTDWESAERIYFRRACVRVLEATIAWARNYAAAARDLAAGEGDEARKAELLAIAERCERVPAEPPRDFREAIQAFWFVYLAGHIEGSHLGYSPGRFDRYMYPYYKRDIDAGRISNDEVLELLEALRVKMTEIEYVASFSWEGLGSGNLFQNMILGGVDEHGRPADNELSMLILQSAINCRTTQPTLSIWYDDGLSDEFLLKAAECVKTGCGFPAWFNLRVFAQHELQKSGAPLSVIRKYAAMGGCTEPTLEGMSHGIVQAGFVNHGKILELAMNGGVDPRTGIAFTATAVPTNTDELLAAYEVHMRDAIGNWQRYWNYAMAAHRQTCPLIFSSALVRDCIARGKSLDDGGAVCNGTPTTLSSGLVNAVNSIAAVRKLVDEDRVCTFGELREACLSNWEGRGDLKRRALDAPKWGNNDDAADRVYEDLFDRYCDVVAAQKNYLGEPYDPSMLAITTHTPFGKACGATPDGRSAGDALADGVTSPYPGTDVNGPFAVLLSSSKIDHTRIRGGLHNMKFHPKTIWGVEGSKKLLSLIKSYFDRNGFQLQFNVVDGRMLRDAQARPELYRDLIVRVAGFSAFFVELGKPVQDQIIARTEHSL